MAKRTLSFSDYNEPTWEEYTGEDPPANKWFNGTVTKAKYIEDDDQMMFVVEITDPDSPYKGWGRGWYAPFEGDLKWKFHEIVKALQGGKTTDVSLDWENEKAVATWLKKCRPIKFKTQEYNEKIGIRKVSPLMEAVTTAPAKTAAVSDVDLDDELEDYTEEELGDRTVEELKAILTEEFEAEAPRKKRAETAEDYKGNLINAILDAQDVANEEEGAEEDAEDEADDEFDDGFEDDGDADEEEEEEEPEPEPAPRARRSRAAAPAKAAPAKKAAPATTRRRRG